MIHADRFAAAAIDAIQDKKLKAVKPLIGSVDQFIDNVDFLSNPGLCRMMVIFLCNCERFNELQPNNNRQIRN